MNCPLRPLLFVVLSLLAFSCQSVPPEQVPETRTIPAVTPYSTLTDSEINAKYLARLLELQELNKEMAAANSKRDFGTVHAKAKDGLVRAYDARSLAQHFDDPGERAKRLKGISKIIADLENLVKMTDVQAGEDV